MRGLAVSGELSQQSAGLVSGAVSAALANSRRVLVDVSGLRVTWPPAVGLFGSILADMGGWPGMRLVLFGADAKLTRSLAALRVSETVPVASTAAVRQITVRLTKQHGAAAVRDLVDALADELADANYTIASINAADGDEGDGHNGLDAAGA